ncbi:hypothetical protein Tco_0059294 [Tanacetum coccineum]|uniref:Uncharacterized protein n=1 Tax=Tanacetum coccineum TaxID=301880 RepID=A0ABQ5IMY7_9ASTR
MLFFISRRVHTLITLLNFSEVLEIGNGPTLEMILIRFNITKGSSSRLPDFVLLLSTEILLHDLISYLKLKRFSSYIGIALLMITGGLDMALDLNYSLGRLVDDLWASELIVPYFQHKRWVSTPCPYNASNGAALMLARNEQIYVEMINGLPKRGLASPRPLVLAVVVTKSIVYVLSFHCGILVEPTNQMGFDILS